MITKTKIYQIYLFIYKEKLLNGSGSFSKKSIISIVGSMLPPFESTFLNIFPTPFNSPNHKV